MSPSNHFNSDSGSAKVSKFKISLFWKIFVWFAFAVFIMVLLTGFLVIQTGNTPKYYEMPISAKKGLFKMAKRIKKIGMLPRAHLHDPIQYHLISDSGEIRGLKELPKAVKILHKHYIETQESQVVYFKKHKASGPVAFQFRGEKHYLYSSHNIRKMHWMARQQFMEAIQLPQMIVLLLVATILCFGLSWYIVSPIKKLRQHAKDVADGKRTKNCQALVGHKRDEIGALATDIDHMLSKIANTIETQKQLLSDVSHELRSPLARLQVALELARNKAEAGLNDEFDRIALEADRLNQMIANLLQIATLDRGQLHEKKQLIDINELLIALVEDANFEAQKKQVSIELKPLSDSLTIEGYYHLLSSAIENIIRNAIRYSPIEGVISVTLHRVNNNLEIDICDEGPGAPEDVLDKIFEPFFRPEEARTRDSGGAGLGLAIAKRSVNVHQGTITAHNHEEKGGLCVKIQLKLPKSAKPR